MAERTICGWAVSRPLIRVAESKAGAVHRKPVPPAAFVPLVGK